MPDPARFLSAGVERFLAALSAAGRPTGANAWPANIDRASLRIGAHEAVDSWFRRSVDAHRDSDPTRCMLEENMAAFAHLEWTTNSTLRYANVTILRVDRRIDRYYADSDGATAQYLRLDLDYRTLGPAFTHPLPHVHVGSREQSVRMSLEPADSPNVVTDFLELAYRHFQHETWLHWARSIWERDFRERYPDEDDNPLERILEAFRTSQFEQLGPHRDDIRRMRELIRQRMQEIVGGSNPVFDLTASVADRGLVAFPA